MAENREYLTRAEENGSINIAEDVVAAIAADAIGEIEGVGSMCQNMTEQITEQFTGKKGLRGVRAEVKDGEIIVDVYLMVRYGYVIPETARKVQDSVSAAVRFASMIFSIGRFSSAAISSSVGSLPSSCTSLRLQRVALLITSTICTGTRMVRA